MKSRRDVDFIQADLPVEPLHHKFAAFVVHRAPRHVERLDLGRRRGLYRLEIAFADHEVIFNDSPERVERQKKRHIRLF